MKLVSVIVLSGIVTSALAKEEFDNLRGPDLYNALVRSAKSDIGRRQQKALSMLRITAQSRYLDPIPGDPALIRIFRKHKDLVALALLKDSASLPFMRSALRSKDGQQRFNGLFALALMKDASSVPELLRMLDDPIEKDRNFYIGEFGPAGWALRATVQRSDVDQLLSHASKSTGYARAVSINMVGYIGTSENIADLKKFSKDSNSRVVAATENAIARIRGGLSRDPLAYRHGIRMLRTWD